MQAKGFKGKGARKAPGALFNTEDLPEIIRLLHPASHHYHLQAPLPSSPRQ